ncbi:MULTISPECIES: extracellular solute-binding protein [unclassified Agarivorans]|uniref:extracellular solute-binding protein n=1 Tax=unclassified Agarivorans TaxID=2636026 RepID=UPI0010D5EFD0|nr:MULTISPECIES: extracellular solute-binding protein [unclassified Agarivorans]MDO6686526.1 extracellular solute-binding protein [Agarivorans sp. 3_MG-2023]MDO6715344.1 extracellular solute-binding protein [Agarivorans sp. 2_MG-2023]MDO6763339.1 extracellular solute-binding protein [Agarivorans sp. 1_MG-2023]GDY26191.1 ABC transporter substrate-binding protein [Agarivorans sp. Toyoura001]
MFNKKKLGTVALALGTTLALTATSAWAKTTLTVASFPSFDLAVQSAIPLYKKINPDVEIKLVSLAYGDHHNAMTTALATGGNLPDVMGIEYGYIGRFASSGGLEDLRAAPYSAEQYEKLFSKFTVPLATGGSGTLAAIPADIGPGALFFREDIFTKAGVTEEDLIKDWDSFIAAGKKIKETTGSYLVASAVDIKDVVIRSGLKDGEGIYFDAEGNITVNNDRFKEAFRLAKAVREAGIDAQVGAWSSEWTEGLRRGTIASQMMGAWLGGHLANWIAPESKGLWRSAALPGGTYASWGGSFYAIPKKAKNKAEAWEFIKFMTMDKEMQIAAFRDLDAFPALVEAQNDDFINQPIPYLGGQVARVEWKNSADRIPAMDVHKHDPVAEQIINDALEGVLERDENIDAALAEAEKQIKRRARR